MCISRTITALALAASTVLIVPPAVAESAAPARAPRIHRGSGDDVIRIKATKARGFVKLTHRGESNFAVWAIKPSGGRGELLVNTIGGYSGATVYNVYSWSKTAAFKIAADGEWTAQIFPITSAPLWKTATVRLAGDRVLKLKTPARGLRSLRYRHTGKSNFAVHAFPATGNPELLVNKIGKVSGRVLLPAGTKYVSVQADGKWYLVRR